MSKIIMTGASSGFGLTVRKFLCDLGHDITTIGNCTAGTGEGRIEDDHFCDFSCYDRMGLSDYVGGLVLDQDYHILINNAGQMELGNIGTQLPYRFERDIQINLIAPFVTCQAFIRTGQEFKANEGHFRIINTASMAYRQPGRECPGYVASKAGLEALTRALARELAEDCRFILCNIAPAMVADTGMQKAGHDHLQKVRGMTEEEAKKYQSGLRGSMIGHDELCRVFRFAIEDMPWAMSGTTLTIPAGSGV